MLLGRGPEI
uniref:Uncharacterized protein n=1 Tax=Rhizophora mucronata TaxID=61149 RepID=A0A2P2PP48_RHIMU